MSGEAIAVGEAGNGPSVSMVESSTRGAVEEAIRRVLDLCYLGGISYAPAAKQVLEGLEDTTTIRELAVVGLAKMAADANHHFGSVASEAAARSQFMGNFHVRRMEGRQVVSVLDRGFEVAEGVFKPLRAFTLEDLDAMILRSKALAKGFRAVVEWGLKAKGLLLEHQAQMIDALPAAAVKVLEEAWPQ